MAVAAPCLGVSKARWDGAGSSLGQWKVDDWMVPSNPNHSLILFYDSVIFPETGNGIIYFPRQGAGIRRALRSLPTQATLGFCDTKQISSNIWMLTDPPVSPHLPA